MTKYTFAVKHRYLYFVGIKLIDASFSRFPYRYTLLFYLRAYRWYTHTLYIDIDIKADINRARPKRQLDIMFKSISRMYVRRRYVIKANGRFKGFIAASRLMESS